ncbi:MAG: CRISPR-associated endoribonuclease Cas6 [Candidatus Aenigmatarchaeota archaeon]
MRILLKLEAEKNSEYDLKYFHKLQGFIYTLLKGTEYGILHDKHGYKFFCFSNIFPIGDIKTGDKRNLLISSPDHLFIKFLKDKLEELKSEKKIVNIGEMLFKVEEVSLLKFKLKKSCKIISATPIVIRIPEKNYEKYGIEEKKKRYVYWRPIYSFEAFLNQLEGNLFKKYNEFNKTKIEEFPLFEKFKFKKSTCNHIIISGKEQKVIGSMWEFIFSHLTKEQKKILEFGIDCGFGERNSMGFGFINVIKNTRENRVSNI